jgi:hypothetical protein
MSEGKMTILHEHLIFPELIAAALPLALLLALPLLVPLPVGIA